MDVFIISIIVLCSLILVSYAGSIYTKNYAHVNRIWAILPSIFVLIWAIEWYQNISFIIPTCLIILWSIQQTINNKRKGIYKWEKGKGFIHQNDRSLFIKNRIHNKYLFEAFNLVFISTFQLSTLFLLSLPLYLIGQTNHKIELIDIALYVLFFAFFALEYIADEQQHQYYSNKETKKNKDTRFLLGFNTYGLWKHSRHPNYVGEVGQWFTLWLLSVSATQKINWSGIGILLLIVIIIGYTIVTEKILCAKFPEYRRWKKATPMFIPGFLLPIRKKFRKIFWAKVE